MAKKAKHHVLTLNHALFSYMLVFLIPTVVLALLVRFCIMNELLRKEEQSIRNELEYMCDTLDRQVKNFTDIANLIFFDDEILECIGSGDLPQNYRKFLKLQEGLRKMMASNTMIDELVLYIPGTEWCISTNSSYLLKNYLLILSFEGIDTEKELYSYLNIYEKYRILHAYRRATKDALTMYVYSLESGSAVKRPVLLFSTQASDYHGALRQAVGERVGAAFVTDADGKVISYYCNDPAVSHLAYAEMLSEAAADKQDHYLFVNMVSNDGNRVYSVVIDKRSIDSSNAYLHYMWFGLVAIVLLFGTNIALLIGYRSYKPIKQLRSRASTLLTEKSGENDDYQFLVETLNYLDRRHELLQNSLNSSNHYLIFRLLKGSLNSAEELRSLSEIMGIPVEQASFQVLLLQTGEKYSPQVIDAELRSCLPPSSNVLLLQEEGETVAILVYDRREPQQNPPVLPKASYLTGCGSVQEELQKVPLSYAEAAVGARENPACAAVCQQLEAAVRSRDLRGVSLRLEELAGIAASASLADSKLCTVRFLLILTEAAQENHTQNRLTTLPDPYTALKYRYREEYMALFNYYNGDFVKELIQPNAICGENLNSRMTRYLQEHYNDMNFSLQQMADDFKLTPLALSRQFLELNGQTPSDYMTHYRIETAKLLLTTTELNVNRIAMEVGYYNVNSFIRRFGQVVGVTPGKYRAQSGKKQTES